MSLNTRRAGARILSFVVHVTPLVAAACAAGFVATRSDALDRAQALYRRARDPGSLATAHRLAREHLARRPWSFRAARLAALTLSALDFPKEAEPFYRRSGPLDRDALLARAQAILRSNDREGAIAAYQEILKRWPDDVTALRLIGGVYFSRRQYPEALVYAARLQRTEAGAAEGHRLAATIQHEMGDPDAAVAHYEQVIASDPSLGHLADGVAEVVWFNYASDLISTGRADEAVLHLERAVSQSASAALRTLLGRAYRQLGQADRAEACWREAIQADATLGAAWLELGRLQASRGELDAAMTSLETAADRAPEDDEVLYALMNVYRRKGMSVQAAAIGQRLATARAGRAPRRGGMGAPVAED